MGEAGVRNVRGQRKGATMVRWCNVLSIHRPGFRLLCRSGRSCSKKRLPLKPQHEKCLGALRLGPWVPPRESSHCPRNILGYHAMRGGSTATQRPKDGNKQCPFSSPHENPIREHDSWFYSRHPPRGFTGRTALDLKTAHVLRPILKTQGVLPGTHFE